MFQIFGEKAWELTQKNNKNNNNKQNQQQQQQQDKSNNTINPNIYDYLEQGKAIEFPTRFLNVPPKYNPIDQQENFDNLNQCTIEKIVKQKGYNEAFLMKSSEDNNLFLYAEKSQYQNGLNQFLIYPYEKNKNPAFNKNNPMFRLIIHSNLRTYSLWNLKCQNCYLSKNGQKCSEYYEHSQQIMTFDHYLSNKSGINLHCGNCLIPQNLKQIKAKEIKNKKYEDINEKIKDNDKLQNKELLYKFKVICPQTTGLNDNQEKYTKFKQQQQPNPDFQFRNFTQLMHTQNQYPDDCIFIRTKFPIYSSQQNQFLISSNKRMKLSSKRNFQLRLNDDEDRQLVIFQMGKIKKGEYIIDYGYPLNFVQAMAIGLTTHNWAQLFQLQQQQMKIKK